MPGLMLCILLGCVRKPGVEDLQVFAPVESYPEEVYLDTVKQKRALIYVAHDDDDCAMSGTIARLTAEGWQIRQMSLVSHPDPKTGKNPAHLICQGNELILEDGIYRPGVDTMAYPYMPIPYEDIESQFLTEKVAQAVLQQVDEYQPSVLFMLDDIKGGYGHPEHIFISRLLVKLFEEGRLPVERIYQSVLSPHMEREIVYTWLNARLQRWGYPNASLAANEMYGIEGMPAPDVQVNIKAYAAEKMAYLRAYGEDVKKNLNKFLPYFEDFDAETYFSVFDREFFRVLEK